MKETITKILQEAAALKQSMLNDVELIQKIESVVELIVKVYKAKGAIYFCGNGGSAADAQHLAAEFTGRFYIDRPPLKAEALHVNPSFVTAVANDYDFTKIYSRAIEAQGNQGDVLFCLSTSGTSPNIIEAAKQAQKMGVTTIAMTGSSDNPLTGLCDHNIMVASGNTPRIQEGHMLVGHIICELVEATIYGK